MAFLGALLDLLLPQLCAGCGHAPGLVCPACAVLLTGPARTAWPSPPPRGLPPPWAVTPYQGPVRAMLLAHKEHARTALAVPLGTALATAVAAAGGGQPVRAGPGADRGGGSGGGLVVVPVPSARGVTRARGHDPVLRMAGRAALVLRGRGVRVEVVGALAQVRRVGDQAGLSAAARAANLAGALGAPSAARVSGRAVVLVDDVITTGATLAEAARALRAAGARVLGCATVAATERRAGPVARGR